MTHPSLIINYYAILAAMAAAFVFGFLWYGPLLGKVWAKEMGLPADFKPDQKKMMIAMVLQVVGLFLTSYVLAHSGQVWRPSVWGVGADEGSNYMWGIMSAFFTWLGFYVPMQFGKVAWEGRSWKLFGLNTTHDFLNLSIMSLILAYWR